MLVALAQNPDGLTPAKLSILTGISRTGGTWRIYMKDLRDAGWVFGETMLGITAEGIKALGAFDPLPTGEALRHYWRGRLGNSGKRAMFDALVAAYPRGMTRQMLSEKIDMATSGGTWRIYLKELRDLELVECAVSHDELRASHDLFR
jgi:hypothetical protein